MIPARRRAAAEALEVRGHQVLLYVEAHSAHLVIEAHRDREAEAGILALELAAKVLGSPDLRNPRPRRARWAWPYVEHMRVTLEGDAGSGPDAGVILRAAAEALR